MKKILLVAGHGAGDPGAIGCGYQEANLTREFMYILNEELKDRALGTLYNPERNCYEDTKIGGGLNKYTSKDFDLAIECHFNSFSDSTANGTELLIPLGVIGASADDNDKAILSVLNKYFKNRGIKQMALLNPQFALSKGISYTYIEMCFISNNSDMATYQANKKQIAKEIASVLVGGETPSQQPSQGPSQPQAPSTGGKSIDEVAREVINGMWGNGADRQTKLTNAGYDYQVVQNKVNELLGATSATSTGTITKGSKVVVTNPISYDGVHLGVSGVYDVIEVKGDRVVIGKGSAVTSAIHINNIRLA